MADPDEILLTADEKMDSAITAFRRELNGIRTGRAHPSLIETLPVDYYGAITPLKQLGTINAPEARLLTVQVWDRGAVSAVQKAIQSSDLGLNPAIDGQTLRLPIPPLTEQRRKEAINSWTVGLAAGRTEGAPLQFAAELARARRSVFGEASARTTRDALAEVCAMLEIPPPASTPDEVGTTELALALDALVALPPLDKPVLLKVLVTLGRTPGDPNYDAFVRAVAAAIDCPVPRVTGQRIAARRDAPVAA